MLKPQRSFYSCPKPIFPTQIFFILELCPSTSTSTGTSTSTRTSTGVNGHFRRDPDVISRLPDTTLDFLSVFIGFRSLSRVKMIVSDENIAFV